MDTADTLLPQDKVIFLTRFMKLYVVPREQRNVI